YGEVGPWLEIHAGSYGRGPPLGKGYLSRGGEAQFDSMTSQVIAAPRNRAYFPNRNERQTPNGGCQGFSGVVVMKSYHANSGAGLAGLVVKEHPTPQPGPREILMRVRANSLNFREISVLRGNYPLPVKPDVVMGADGAGEVVALGEGVTRVRVGDRVAAAMFPRWIDGPFAWEHAPQIGGSLDGMMAEFVVLSEDAVVRFPDHLSFEEAATLPCAGVTAWNALVGGRRLSAGDTILTLGSGGVSLFALQFAKMMGARVI